MCKKRKCRQIGINSFGPSDRQQSYFISTNVQRNFIKRVMNGCWKSDNESEQFTVMLCHFVSIIVLRVL